METTWQVGDNPDTIDPTPAGRARDCTRGGGRNNPGLTLLECLAEYDGQARRSFRDGARILDPDVIEAMSRRLRHRTSTVTVTELRQLAARKVITLTSLGDGQFRYTITDLGVGLWLETLESR